MYSSIPEPSSYLEASKDTFWIKAMKLEILALEKNNTWSIMDLSPGKVPIGCKWVYKVKYKASVNVERYKSILISKGYSQKNGLDYSYIFSLVVRW